MPLIRSVSGVRGIFGDGLSPADLVRYAEAFGVWCRERADELDRDPVVVLGRDGRMTGDICARLVSAALQSVGCDVIYCGLATTPTVQMAVLDASAAAGIVLSASHNPAEWNALKLLNQHGEFISDQAGEKVYEYADGDESFTVDAYSTGDYETREVLDHHIESVLDLPFIDSGQIAEQGFRVVVDGINSVGGLALPRLLRRLGVTEHNIICLNCEPHGVFAHPPEPIPEHLESVLDRIPDEDADLGLVVDPDADRLALIDENGRFIGEELTQVLAADFMWNFRSGPFVTNLSSSRTVEDVAEKHGETVYRSAVGEINVVEKMKEVEAILGGEGNGGVILPDLHYGRDGLVGTAFVLQYLANTGKNLSEIVDSYPSYTIAKKKIDLDGLNPDRVFEKLGERYRDEKLSRIDGLKIDFDRSWVHLRTSNTEPVMRVYAEAVGTEKANALAERFLSEISEVG